MQGERSFARLILNYMKKHGDTVDHDEAEKWLADLDQEEVKRRQVDSEDAAPAQQAVVPAIEGEVKGQGVQLTSASEEIPGKPGETSNQPKKTDDKK